MSMADGLRTCLFSIKQDCGGLLTDWGLHNGCLNVKQLDSSITFQNVNVSITFRDIPGLMFI